MAIAHITAAQVAEFGLVSAPTIMNGTPQDNKARFDKMNRELVVVVVNSIIDQTNLLLVAEDKRTAQETGRVNAETLRVAAETARVTAETARAEAENARSAAETARDNAEKNRDNGEAARKTAQDAWVNAEAARVAAEVLRVEAEKARVTAETGRATAETTRGQAEAARGTAEGNRATAETSRQTAEQTRNTDEAARKNAETSRGQAESGRATAETGRTTAETARDTAEKARATAETSRSEGEKTRETGETARKTAEDQRVARDAAEGFCEPYDPLRDYVVGNKAVQSGSTYRCTAPCRGIAPPNSAKWLLVAAKGLDGKGSGDMLAAVYDPTGKGLDVFAFAETKKAEAIEAAGADATAKAGAVNRNLVEHMGDVTHVTAAEKQGWNGKAAGSHTHAAEDLPSAMPPTLHRDSHKVGGADALVAADIGAAAVFGPVLVAVPVTWSGAGPWTQVVNVAGVRATDEHIDLYPVSVADAAADKLYGKAFGCLDREFATQNGSILLTCKSGKPETAFQILLKGER